MSKKIHLPIPVQKDLRRLGKNISDASRRRRIATELMSERSGFSRITLSKIEKGDPSVSMGAYASALFVLWCCNKFGLKILHHHLDNTALEFYCS